MSVEMIKLCSHLLSIFGCVFDKMSKESSLSLQQNYLTCDSSGWVRCFFRDQAFSQQNVKLTNNLFRLSEHHSQSSILDDEGASGRGVGVRLLQAPFALMEASSAREGSVHPFRFTDWNDPNPLWALCVHAWPWKLHTNCFIWGAARTPKCSLCWRPVHLGVKVRTWSSEISGIC